MARRSQPDSSAARPTRRPLRALGAAVLSALLPTAAGKPSPSVLPRPSLPPALVDALKPPPPAHAPNASQAALPPMEIPRGVNLKHFLVWAEMPAGSGNWNLLASRGADTQQLALSTSKLMTALLVYENDPTLIGYIQFTREDKEGGGMECSCLDGVAAGQWVSKRDAMHSLLMASDNDTARALARDTAGSEEAFVARMNERAAELGLKSQFFNANGLPSAHGPSNTMPTEDLAKLFLQFRQHPGLEEIASTPRHTLLAFDHDPSTIKIPAGTQLPDAAAERDYRERAAGRKRVRLETTNLGLWDPNGSHEIRGMEAAKTGFGAFQHAFTATVLRGDVRLMTAILGMPSAGHGHKFDQTRLLVDAAERHLRPPPSTVIEAFTATQSLTNPKQVPVPRISNARPFVSGGDSRSSVP